MKALTDISREQLDQWRPLCGDLRWSPAAATTDGDYPVQLSPNGDVIEFAPDGPWGVTIRRLPAPGHDSARVWLLEATRAQC